MSRSRGQRPRNRPAKLAFVIAVPGHRTSRVLPLGRRIALGIIKIMIRQQKGFRLDNIAAGRAVLLARAGGRTGRFFRNSRIRTAVIAYIHVVRRRL